MKLFIPAVFLIAFATSFSTRADDFYISCLTDNTIAKISGDTASIFSSGTAPFWGLAVDRLGNLYVSNQGVNGILKYASVNGTLSTTPTVFASGLHAPLGLAFDQSGNLYESESCGNINKFIFSGRTLSDQPVLFVDGSSEHANLVGSRQPDDLAFDQQGNLYVAIEIGGILKFTNSPSGLSNMPDEKPFSTVSRARQMAFDKKGNLFTANHLVGENYVYEYSNTPSGLSSTPKIFAKGNGLDGPYGVTIDSVGNLYVTNWGFYQGTDILEYPVINGILSNIPVVYATGFGSPVLMVAIKSQP
jgi:glucose/arabinose dehydrogenase